MKNKLATILCLGLLFSPKSFSNAKTGNFSWGVHAKTSYVLHAEKALKDYYLWSEDVDEHLSTAILYNKSNNNSDVILSKFPIVAGLNFEYSTYFTDKFGVSFHGNWGAGNILVVTPIEENIKKHYADMLPNASDGNFYDKKRIRKISIMDLGGDFRLKYDIFNSSFDFNDYGRNSLVGSISLGVKSNWLLIREFCTLEKNLAQNKVEGNDKENTNDFSSDRINCWFPGAILGVDVVFDCNFGVGIDAFYSFKNLFTKNDRLVEKDKKFREQKNHSKCVSPTYSESCHLLQFEFRIYYDFGAFINNHEAPSEIDIEKW